MDSGDNIFLNTTHFTEKVGGNILVAIRAIHIAAGEQTRQSTSHIQADAAGGLSSFYLSHWREKPSLDTERCPTCFPTKVQRSLAQLWSERTAGKLLNISGDISVYCCNMICMKTM